MKQQKSSSYKQLKPIDIKASFKLLCTQNIFSADYGKMKNKATILNTCWFKNFKMGRKYDECIIISYDFKEQQKQQIELIRKK